MAKAKAKSQEEAQKRAKAISQGVKNQITKQAVAPNAWAKEIEKLKTRKFANIDEAVYAVASGVASRLGSGTQSSEAEIEFLMTFLKSDPSIIDELKRSLLIA